MKIVSRGSVLMAALVIASGSFPLVAQGPDSAGSRGVQRLPAEALAVPFKVGERLDYEVRFGSLKVGNGSMEVRDITEVRGRPAWHTVFTISGGFALYRVNDRYESWFDVTTLNSLRYHQDVDEGSYERTRRYEIFPERGMFRENDAIRIKSQELRRSITDFGKL